MERENKAQEGQQRLENKSSNWVNVARKDVPDGGLKAFHSCHY